MPRWSHGVLRLPFVTPFGSASHRCRDRAEELLLPHLIAFARLSVARFALRHGVPARTGPSALRSAKGADADGAQTGGDRSHAASAEVQLTCSCSQHRPQLSGVTDAACRSWGRQPWPTLARTTMTNMPSHPGIHWAPHCHHLLPFHAKSPQTHHATAAVQVVDAVADAEVLRHSAAVAAAVPDPPPPSTPTAPARSTASDLYPTNDFFDPVMSGTGASAGQAALGLGKRVPRHRMQPITSQYAGAAAECKAPNMRAMGAPYDVHMGVALVRCGRTSMVQDVGSDAVS